MEARRLIENYKNSPPTQARERAYRLRDLWNSYPKAKRRSLREKKGNYWSFPELPLVTATVTSISQLLINAEVRDCLDVTPCWAAIDAGVPQVDVKSILCKARQKLHDTPDLNFVAYLDGLLQVRAGRNFAAVTPPLESTHPTANAAPTQLVLDARHQKWMTVRAFSMDLSPREYIHRLIEEDARRSGTIAFVEASSRVDLKPTAPIPIAPLEVVRKAPRAKAAPMVIEKSADNEELPALHERLRVVMGHDSVTIEEAMQRLEGHAKGWLPYKDGDARVRVGFALSTHTTDLFDRVSRGVYKVKHPITFNGKSSRLEDLGTSVLENPFTGALNSSPEG